MDKLWIGVLVTMIILTPIGGALLCGIVWLLKGAPVKSKTNEKSKQN